MNRLEIIRLIIGMNYHFLKKKIDTKRLNELELEFSNENSNYIGDVKHNDKFIVKIRGTTHSVSISGRGKDGYFKIYRLNADISKRKEETIIKLIVLDRFC